MSRMKSGGGGRKKSNWEYGDGAKTVQSVSDTVSDRQPVKYSSISI